MQLKNIKIRALGESKKASYLQNPSVGAAMEGGFSPMRKMATQTEAKGFGVRLTLPLKDKISGKSKASDASRLKESGRQAKERTISRYGKSSQ